MTIRDKIINLMALNGIKSENHGEDQYFVDDMNTLIIREINAALIQLRQSIYSKVNSEIIDWEDEDIEMVLDTIESVSINISRENPKQK
jgi:hypothetical protein